MQVYKTGGFKELIETVKVDRVSDKSVWINGYRTTKRGAYGSYWDSIEEAKQHLISNLQNTIERCSRQIEAAEKELELINEKYK